MMIWTDKHDVLLCREILSKNPFASKKSSPQRGQLWLEVAENLAQIREPNFKTDLDRRAVRDRYNLLSSKLRKKLKYEEKASGIETNISEVELLLEQLIEYEDAAEALQKANAEENKNKAMEDRENAQDMRLKAMEKLAETKRRKENENQQTVKRKRSNGNETVQYLREKNELLTKFRNEDRQFKEQKQREENQRQQEFMKMLSDQQGQLQQQQQQFQATMLQQQQQQNQLMMAIISKLGSK